MNTTINIPAWLAETTDLNWNEKALYAVYHYFTFNGKKHCCTLSKTDIMNRLGLSEDQYKKSKSKLSKLGWIKTSNNKSWTVANFKNSTTDNMADCNQYQNDTTSKNEGCQNTPVGVLKSTSRGAKNHPLNNKERIKKNKEDYISTLTLSDNTSNISTSITEVEKSSEFEDSFFLENYGICKLEYILQYGDDELDVLNYLAEHPTTSNLDKIKNYWSEDDEKLEMVTNMGNSLKIA